MTRVLALLVAVLVAGCTGGCTKANDDSGPNLPGEWVAAASLPGGPRQETAVVAVNSSTSMNAIYVLGGFDDMGNIVDTVERFAFTNSPGGWSQVAPLPVPMHHANAAVVNGKIWVVGFLTGLAFDADGRVFQYDPAADEWTEGTPMPLGTERGASGVAVELEGSDIFVAGGLREGAAVADFSVFSATTGTGGAWTGLVNMPAPRDHLGAGVIDGVFYAVGGRNTLINSHVPDVLAWNPSAPSSWTPKSPMPTSRGGAATFATGGGIYVFGGEGNTATESGVFSEVERYDALRDTWRSYEPMLTPRHGTGAAKIDDEDYPFMVPGGADREAFSAVDTVELLTFPTPPGVVE